MIWLNSPETRASSRACDVKNARQRNVSDFSLTRRIKLLGRSLTMKYLILSIAVACLLAISSAASRQIRAPRSDAINQTFNVDGVERTVVIYPGAKPAPKAGAPLVLGFHG